MRLFIFHVIKQCFLAANLLMRTGAESVLDYVVDCSACQKAPLTNINSFSCNIRCEVDGEFSLLCLKESFGEPAQTCLIEWHVELFSSQ